ncbi:MAG: gamma-glutamyltransferase, partial [Candidatus Cloacimonetes bacterium]|nr:gamma-glutamyltransferase [Candidatus Cloacimonadota bacterium]
LDLVDYGMDPADALALPRYHQQWRPALLMLEPAFSPASRTRLRELGWELDERTEPWSVASLLLRDPDGRLRGAADPRADGLALGY